ncbi:MAG: ribbon-helix-helix domain-containing protein [Candidatus Nanoarchaeia archaeon]|nr:ribbon-helix-helix domain-containing protein [Candidatus Nanoarchaeia archaeon]
MPNEKIVPIQFNGEMVDEIEKYIESGLYSSKAEFVRDAVRKLIIEIRKEMFFNHVEKLRELSKSRGAKIKSPFVPEKIKEEAYQKLKKRIMEREGGKKL